jgi:23S rRNA (uracil1939-C5)-methyltransferase
LQLETRWQQGQIIELMIDDLSATGDGVGRCQERVVFVPDSVPGDHLQVRLTQVKSRYAHAEIATILTPAPDRVRPACIVADKCGGCQWQPVSYARQLQAKQAQVVDALERIGKFTNLNPPIAPILPAPAPLGYRNKVTYPLGRGDGKVLAGYYRKGSHRLVNLNQCPVQDPRLNPLLAGIKQDLHQQGWSVYNEQTQRGLLRHLGLRIGRRTGQMLVTLVVRDWQLPNATTLANHWLKTYPGLVGVCLNRNPEPGNRIFGSETRCLAGQAYLEEEFAGLRFQIGADTFFQIYTEQAEALLQLLLSQLQLNGHEQILDAYCGIGTLSLPLAKQCQRVLGLELHPPTVAQAEANAALNGLTNLEFWAGAVEDQLTKLPFIPDVVVLDPPRKGCDPAAIQGLSRLRSAQIVYMSCNPATLARDLQLLTQSGDYRLKRVQPADFFPQTAHVEALAVLELVSQI